MRQTNFRRIAAALLALVLVLGAAGSVLGAADAKASPPSVLPTKAEPKTGVTVYANDKASIDASNLAEMWSATATIFFYDRLLLERFLYDLPVDVSARYSSQIFNRQTAKLFNDEMLHTIETFFENSLNLSETARKLYIHRNTLVYRLEKVQRAIGLDLRSFDDAVTFKMMMLLGKNTQSRKNRL